MRNNIGIHLVKPTGKVSSSNNQYIEVELPSVDSSGRQFMIRTFARPCYSFGDVSAPSENWLNKYKDEIMICLIFEEGNPSIPMWIGYTPTSKLSENIESFPNGFLKRTEKFFVQIDDSNERFDLAYREEKELGQVVTIFKNYIQLGDNNSKKEKALLGDSSVSLLSDLIKAIKRMVFATPAGNTIKLLTIPEFEEIESRLDSLLSKSVKLD